MTGDKAYLPSLAFTWGSLCNKKCQHDLFQCYITLITFSNETSVPIGSEKAQQSHGRIKELISDANPNKMQPPLLAKALCNAWSIWHCTALCIWLYIAVIHILSITASFCPENQWFILYFFYFMMTNSACWPNRSYCFHLPKLSNIKWFTSAKRCRQITRQNFQAHWALQTFKWHTVHTLTHKTG